MVKSARNAGDRDSIPGSGRSPGEGIGKPFQYSCLENPMDSPQGQKKIVRHDLATTTRASPPCYKEQCLQGLALSAVIKYQAG